MGIYEAGHQEAALAVYDFGSESVPCQGDGLPVDDDGGVGEPLMAIPYVDVFNGSP